MRAIDPMYGVQNAASYIRRTSRIAASPTLALVAAVFVPASAASAPASNVAALAPAGCTGTIALTSIKSQLLAVGIQVRTISATET